MKLIDILVDELPKRGGWPEDAAFVAQEEGGELWSFISKPHKDCDDEWMDESSSGYHNKVGKLPEASDHDTSVITREQYESALAAKNEGWIEWAGGECPVEKGTLVDVRYRNGKENHHVAAGVRGSVAAGGDLRGMFACDWSNGSSGNDIIAYRLHQPKKSEQVRADAWNAYTGIEKVNDEADLNDCIGQTPAAEWNGDGLPPVGCECEAKFRHRNSAEWMYFRCVAVDCDVAFGWAGKDAVALEWESYQFRHIRSEAERKRDESLRVIYEILDAGTSTNQDAADIYDAIAAGKIPGVKLDD